MTSSQKIIKYFGYALAVFIIVNIISLAFYGIGSLMGAFNVSEEPSSSTFKKSLNSKRNSITRLEIEVSRVNLIIEEGNSFDIETSNKYITSRIKDNTLYIEEKKHSIFKRDKGDVIITVPSDKKFLFVSLEAGLSNISIDKIFTDTLMLDLGAGKTSIRNLVVNDRADIDGGAGNIEILSSDINNMDLDMGVGNVDITSSLRGNSKIDTGVGNIDIRLTRGLDEYKFNIDKGIGNVKVNGENIKNLNLDNNGENIIDISGGIGNVNITTVDI